MKQASSDLYEFIKTTACLICDFPHEVRIGLTEAPTMNTITVFVYCKQSDIRYIASKIREIKTIAIAIARKHRVFVNLLIGGEE